MATTQFRVLEVVDPATLEPVGSVPATHPAAVQEAVAEARLAQERWAETPFSQRAALLGRVATVVLDSFDELAATITSEVGKPLAESAASDLLPALETIVWCGRNAGKALRQEPVPGPPFLRHKRGRLVHEPLGVVAGLTPWNFPLSIPLGLAAAAVAAGNAIVLKPSELAPLTGAWVERAFREAGAPPALVRVVQGEADVGSALVAANGVARVVFTGSPEVGKQVARAAAERLVPVTLELGGKDPMLVFADADFDRAVDGALWASFANCGQVCAGAERIYVERSLYEPFLEELARRARGLRIGAGNAAGTDLGPLVSESRRDRVESLVADALEAGAELRAGGRRPETALSGWFYEPTVLAGEQGRARDEEIFGPVVCVAAFDGEREAIRRANDSRFALGASVWTRDGERAGRVAAALRAGMVWTNDHAYSYGSGGAAWGGRPGYGRTHSRHGLYELTDVKYVDADPGRRAVPWWYPYDEALADGFRAVSELLYGEGVGRKARALWRGRRGVASLARRYLR
ncbi:MAG TPA: aldehyde dehydrogenase family protein [Gaiellaceae bacterium]|nr:aldehyde dehydrogenase family protein [Gaiellaceae bacterium]